MSGIQWTALVRWPAAMAEMVGSDLMAARHAGTGQLGFFIDLPRSIEDKCFKLREKVALSVLAVSVHKRKKYPIVDYAMKKFTGSILASGIE